MSIYHLHNNYSPKDYHLQYIRIYTALLHIQYKAWELWHDYTQTNEFKKELSEKEFYSKTDDYWDDEHFKQLFDSGMLTRKQMEDSLFEALVWEDWVKRLKNDGIPIIISGKGNKFYRTPGFFDYSVYKFNNFRQTLKQTIKQSRGFTDNGYLLPENITKNRLRDTSEQIQGILDFNKNQEVSP